MTARRTNRGTMIAFAVLAAAAAGGVLFAHLRSPAPEPAPDRVNVPAERAKWLARIAEVGAAPAYRELIDAYVGRHFGLQHTMAHLMGSVLHESGGPENFGVCDASFAFGCYHGFFGRAIAEGGTEVIARLDAECGERYGSFRSGCQHGLGHGILEFVGHQNLLRALEACEATAQRNPLFGCTTGVFMEYNMPTVIEGDTAYFSLRRLDPSDPHAPCSSLPERFQPSCYYEITQWWDKVYRRDFRKIGLLCAEAPPASREGCYYGAGNFASPASGFSLPSTLAKCGAMPPEGQEPCLAGASWSFFSVPSQRELAPEVCGGLAGAARERCVTEEDLAKVRKEMEIWLK